MHEDQTPLQQHIRRDTYIKLVPLAIAAIFGAVLSELNGKVRTGDAGDKLLALVGVMLFLLAAITFLQTATQAITQLLSAHPARHLNKGRTGALRFLMRAIGYVGVALITLELVGIPVGNLLLGGAALGVILGVAAQQALGNFYASIVLIVTHPYSIGDTLSFTAGGLGGKYDGTVKDIGLTHTRLLLESGEMVLFPNAALLSGAAITLATKSKH